MQRRTLLFTASVAALAGPARAAPSPLVLVELFTSQGCSSCPSADAAFARLVRRPDVLPLAYHVTYWDRLGWRDTLGDPDFDRRQRWYGGILGKGLYTPQMVIAGELDLVGSDSRLEQAIDLVAGQRRPAVIDIDATGRVRLPEIDDVGDVRLVGVGYDPYHRVAIERGENAGTQVDYVNTARLVLDLGPWPGQAIDLPAAVTRFPGLAVIAQQRGSGRVVALGRRPTATSAVTL